MRRALKICFLGGYRPYNLRGLRGGGGPNAVSAPLIDAFAKMDLNSIRMIVLSTPFRELGVPVLRPRKLILSENVEVRYIPLLNPLSVIIELAKCDLVHIFALEPQNIIIALLSKILRKKTITTSHGYPPIERSIRPKGLKFRIYNILIRKIIELSDVVTTVSYILRSVLVQVLSIPKALLNKFVVIHNGTDITPILMNKDEDQLKILSVLGRNYLNKGLLVILEALNNLTPSIKKRILFILIGDIPQNLLRKIPHGTKLIRLRKVPHEKLAELYTKAHVILQPSFFESFNLPALEAAGRGCIPIIITRIGVAEIFENEKNAFIVKPGDPESIAKILTLYATNNDLREKMSKEAYKISLNYTYDKVAKKYLSLYLSILKKD
ncbi:MAG: glycosyltransferase [Desulfurococcales archaeon]|jgi:glycosyltransferase involved in cell wall biosynthesis|nr:glycosyltransferase [Desulfurococcales archaeon]